jgi:hypothetical protein
MFDVLNRLTVDAVIAPKKTDERKLAVRHLGQLDFGDILLLDRGYPAFWLFCAILEKGAHFCARVTASHWTVTRRFLRSGQMDRIVTIRIPLSARKTRREMGLSMDPIRVRLIRVPREGGAPLVLMTSLVDEETYTHEDLCALYAKRWPVEEDFKAMKLRTEVENFSGKSVLAVYQDFHAKVFAKNLAAVLIHPVQERVDAEASGKAHPYRINFTQTLSKLKDTLTVFFTSPYPALKRLLETFQKIMAKTLEAVRPNRSFPRKHKVMRKPFYPAYKPAR